MEHATINSETLVFNDSNGAESQPPVQLFNNFWHQGELAVFFGNQQSGKSLLAVQVAEAISSGKPVEGFQLCAQPQKVLYFDFDKSGHHFQKLYSGYSFSPNFRRLVIDKKKLDFRHLAEQFFLSVEGMMSENEARILVFDSLPAIKYFVKDSHFLKGIQRLKELGASILLTGETKKEIKGKPLRLNHLDAHKHLVGFADSVFAMGCTSGEADERYLIHLKATERRIYHKDNVITGRIPFGSAQAGTGVTPVTHFLPGFSFTGYNSESCVLAPPPEGLDLDILLLCQQHPGWSLGQIAKGLKTNKMRVKRVLDRYSYFPADNLAAPPTTHHPSSENPGNNVIKAPLPANPSGGSAGRPIQPTNRGVKTKIKNQTSEVKNSNPKNPNNQLTFSQRLKKQIAQKNVKRTKDR